MGQDGAAAYADSLGATVNLGGLGVVTGAFLQVNHAGQPKAPSASHA